MSLLALPVELWLIVLGSLGTAELNSVIKTNRYLYTILTPLLRAIALEDKDGLPALRWAVLRRHEPLVRLILSINGSLGINDIDTTDERTLLYYAVSWTHYHEGIVRLLLEHGADPDSSGRSMESLLCLTGDESINTARLLLDYGADVNTRACDWFGGTLLSKAARFGQVAMARLLLERGAIFISEKDGGYFMIGAKYAGSYKATVEAYLEIGGARNNHCRNFLLGWADSIGWGEIARKKYGLDKTIDVVVE